MRSPTIQRRIWVVVLMMGAVFLLYVVLSKRGESSFEARGIDQDSSIIGLAYADVISRYGNPKSVAVQYFTIEGHEKDKVKIWKVMRYDNADVCLNYLEQVIRVEKPESVLVETE